MNVNKIGSTVKSNCGIAIDILDIIFYILDYEKA